MEVKQIHALDMEEAVLGALMLEKDAFHRVNSILKPESFYLASHRLVYEAILALFSDSQPIDILTVKNFLQTAGNLQSIGGAHFLTGLTNRVASSANIETHARIITEKYLIRKLSQITAGVFHKCQETAADPFDLMDQAEQDLFQLAETSFRKNYLDMSQLFLKSIERLEQIKSLGLTGIPSGFPALDQLTAGFQKTDLVIIAARPAMGKTAFALNVASNTAKAGKAVALFSLEMGDTQLMNRILCAESEIDAHKFRTGQLQEHDWKQVMSKGGEVANLPIYVDDTPGLSIHEFRSKCRRLKAERKVDIVIIDYLQLMTGPKERKGNREQEISHISRSLKVIAKELDVCIIALSQLSRAVESRGGDKRPMLSDLRESGSIEQDADNVLFLYRPEYYGFETDEEGNSTKGLTEVIISKQRNGPTGTAKLQFISHWGKFTEWSLNFEAATSTEIILPNDFANN